MKPEKHSLYIVSFLLEFGVIKDFGNDDKSCFEQAAVKT